MQYNLEIDELDLVRKLRVNYISVGRMGPRVSLPALDFVSLRGHGVLCLLVVCDSLGDRTVSDIFR